MKETEKESAVVQVKEAEEPSRKKIKANKDFFFFLLLGTVQLFGWNSILNSMNAVTTELFVKTHQTITLSYSGALAVTTAFLIYYNTVSLIFMQVGLLTTAALCVGYALASQLGPKDFPVNLFYGLMAAALALSSALIGSSGFGFASHYPENYCGIMSAGLGVSGLVTFGGWMFSSYVLFDSKKKSGVRGSVWLLMSIGALLAISVFIAATFNLRKVSTKESSSETEKKENALESGKTGKQPEAENSSENTKCIQSKASEIGDYEAGGIPFILNKSKSMAIAQFLNLAITLFCFPILGPYGFSMTALEIDIAMGMFQIFDFFGRYLPNFLPLLLLSRSWTMLASYLRVVFLAIFILSYYMSGTFLAQGPFGCIQILLLATTNGWISTVCSIHIVEMVKGEQAKDRVASFGLLSQVVGIFVGQALAFLVTTVLPHKAKA